MNIRNLTLNDVIMMNGLVGGDTASTEEFKKMAGIIYIMKKTEDPHFTMDDAFKLTIGQIEDDFAKLETGPATPKTKKKAALVGR